MLIAGYTLFMGFVLLASLAVVVTMAALAAQRRAAQGMVLWTLAIAVENNMPLDREVEALASAFRRGKRRRQLLRLHGDLCGGVPLAEALHREKGLVPRSAALAVKVGAANGRLGEALREAAVHHTAPAGRVVTDLSSPLVALGYLSLLTVMAGLIVGFLMYSIVPKFRKIFEDFDMELPGLTMMLIDSSGPILVYGRLFLPAFYLLPVLAVMAMIGYVIGWGEFDVPLLGRRLLRLDVPELLRNLAQTVSAGRPREACLATVVLNHRRLAVRRQAQQALRELESGGECWQALERAGFLRRREGDILRSAERAGNLRWALRELADSLDRRRAALLPAALDLMLPAVVLAIGFVVFLICTAFFLPLVKLISDLS